jgi:hypothetical protein
VADRLVPSPVFTYLAFHLSFKSMVASEFVLNSYPSLNSVLELVKELGLVHLWPLLADSDVDMGGLPLGHTGTLSISSESELPSES